MFFLHLNFGEPLLILSGLMCSPITILISVFSGSLITSPNNLSLLSDDVTLSSFFCDLVQVLTVDLGEPPNVYQIS